MGNRDVSAEHVLTALGKGDVMIGQAAVAAGMADEVGTFESTLARLAAGENLSAGSWDALATVVRLGVDRAKVAHLGLDVILETRR